eukprot:scaffold185395_cov23-Tisochrysis_lutea.AAC.1
MSFNLDEGSRSFIHHVVLHVMRYKRRASFVLCHEQYTSDVPARALILRYGLSYILLSIWSRMRRNFDFLVCLGLHAVDPGVSASGAFPEQMLEGCAMTATAYFQLERTRGHGFA